ncbi:unnamed protein product [Amoebophrya sp. A25]|nr:unnamed protein product [Amoebophrya sp. A25]|eukprot:GSA25T00008810001.1
MRARGISVPQVLPFPIICDESRRVSIQLGILDPDSVCVTGSPLAARSVFLIDPEFRLATMFMYPWRVGRSFKEIIRVLDALQVVRKSRNIIGTPAGWETTSQFCVDDSAVDIVGKEQINLIDVPSGRSYMKYIHPSSAQPIYESAKQLKADVGNPFAYGGPCGGEIQTEYARKHDMDQTL